MPPDIEDVAEALRNEQGGLQAAALDDGVHRQRGAVNEVADAAGRHPVFGEQCVQAVEDSFLRVRRIQGNVEESGCRQCRYQRS